MPRARSSSSGALTVSTAAARAGPCWDLDASALHGLVSGGFSGIARNHSDTSGYTSLSYAGLVGYEREREQLQRWTEMNAFTAVLRTHEGNQPGVNAQVDSNAETIAHFARFSKAFKALAPYRKERMTEAAQKGWPLVRHHWMHYPDDAVARATDDEFLLGSELLVAPIKNTCWTQPFCPYDKEVYLPKGEWTHLGSGTSYGSATQGETGSVKAPIGQPAVFDRKGSAVGASFAAALDALGVAVPPAQP
jgi:alpha-glucosidase (family GH31 glycosyl hydrolase)